MKRAASERRLPIALAAVAAPGPAGAPRGPENADGAPRAPRGRSSDGRYKSSLDSTTTAMTSTNQPKARRRVAGGILPASWPPTSEPTIAMPVT